MAIDRRSFLRSGSLLAVGTVLFPFKALAARPRRNATRVIGAGLPLTVADQAVLEFIGRYSRTALIAGASVLGKLRGNPHGPTHILVSVSDLAALEAALADVPFSGVYSQGNTLSFNAGGSTYTIENLITAAFDARLADLRVAKKIVFAHDGLTYNPVTRELTDPWGGADGDQLKMINRALTSPDALAAFLRGWIDAKTARVGTVELEKWQTKMLRVKAKKTQAHALAQTFLQKLSSVVESVSLDQLKTLLTAPLVASALKQVFGVNVTDAIAAFTAARAKYAYEYSDAALWLAALLGPEIESNASDGAAFSWVLNGARADVARSLAALKEARQFLAV